MSQQSFDDWSEHLHKVQRAERHATDALNDKRWNDAWAHLTAIRESADNAIIWMRKHHGKRTND